VLVVVARDERGGDDHPRALEDLGRLEQLAVDRERGLGVVRAEVVREHERQPELRGDPRAAVGRAEHVNGGLCVLTAHCAHARVPRAQEAA
jgi:hypothetical protein